MEMKKYKLGDVADINKQTISKKDSMDIIEYLDTGSLTENIFGPKQVLSREDAPSRAQRRVFDKTILYSTVRPRLKHYGFLESPKENTIVSTGFATIDVKDEFKNVIDARYLYLLLIQDKVTEYLGTIADTAVSAYPSLNPSDIQSLEFEFPDISIQKKVASTLSSLDKRIENLRAQNRVLEQTAKTIYDYTFLQCAGHQTTYIKTLNRNIPVSWEVKSVNQMAKSCRGVAYDKSDVQKENNGGILVLRGNNIQDNNLVYDGNVVYIPKTLVDENQHIKKGDIIMTMSSGSKEHIGKCTMFQYDSEHTYGAFLTKFTPNRECRYYFYMNLISDYFKAKIKSVCNGTGINNLTNQTFNEIFFPYPDSKTLDVFEKIVTPIFDKIGVNTKQIETLTTQRNTLLPLLMTGQIEV